MSKPIVKSFMSSIKFNADGVNSKITINTPPGSSVTTNADNTIMNNVEQNSSGGVIEHNSRYLTQVGGTQTVKGNGLIVNRVEDGSLRQENVNQSVEDEGVVLNESKAYGNKFFGIIKDLNFWKKHLWLPLLVSIVGTVIAGWMLKSWLH